MTEYIDKEIMDLQDNMKEIESKLQIVNSEKTGTSGVDLEILIEETIKLEALIEHDRKKCNDLLSLREYQLSCEHTFVDDLIDITPDKSKMIKYCSVCLFTCEN